MGNMAEAIIMLYKEVWKEKNVFRTFVGTKFLFPPYQRHHLVNERPVCARDDPLVVDDAGVGEEHAQVDGHLTNPYLFVEKLFSVMRLFFPHHDGGGHRLPRRPLHLVVIGGYAVGVVFAGAAAAAANPVNKEGAVHGSCNLWC